MMRGSVADDGDSMTASDSYHVLSPRTSWKRDDKVRLANEDHLPVTYRPCCPTVLVPIGGELCLGNIPSLSPLRRDRVSASSRPVYQMLDHEMLVYSVELIEREVSVRKRATSANEYAYHRRLVLCFLIAETLTERDESSDTSFDRARSTKRQRRVHSRSPSGTAHRASSEACRWE